MSVTMSATMHFLNLHRTQNSLASAGSLSFPRRQYLCLLSYTLVPFAFSFSTSCSEKGPNPLSRVCPLLRMEVFGLLLNRFFRESCFLCCDSRVSSFVLFNAFGYAVRACLMLGAILGEFTVACLAVTSLVD